MNKADLLGFWTDIFEFREVPGRGVCGLSRMLYTVGLLVDLQEYTYRGRYCFPDLRSARDSLQEWNGVGDPPGAWIKHKGEGGEYGNPALQQLDETGHD